MTPSAPLRAGPRPLRLGLIGPGAWGKNYVRTIEGLKGISLARVAGSKDGWREVAGAQDLDGVIVASPPRLHAEMASFAVERGLPVLVEKPLALSDGEAHAFLKLAKRRKGLVLVDHIYLYHPAFQALKEHAKKLGNIRSIRSVGGNRGPFRNDTPVLWDYGPHDVAMALDLMREMPKFCRADRQKAPKSAKGENLTLRLQFKGALAELVIGNGMKERTRRMEVFFDDKALVFDDTQPRKLSRHALNKEGGLEKGEPLPCGDELPLARAVKAFAAAILSRSSDLSSLELGVSVVDVLAECERSLARPAR